MRCYDDMSACCGSAGNIAAPTNDAAGVWLRKQRPTFSNRDAESVVRAVIHHEIVPCDLPTSFLT